MTVAQLIRQSLIDAGVVANGGSSWPCFYDHLPPTADSSPMNAVCVYVTASVMGGTAQRTGVPHERPGVQVRIRSGTLAAGQAKADAVKNALDAIRQKVIAEGGTSYTVWSVQRRGGVLPLGQDPEDNRAYHHTINAQVTLSSSTT